MGGQQGKKRKAGNPGVGVDFKKVKHKVGKKLPKAQNETDTTIKARSIHLPSQAIKQDKDGQATNFQKLTLKELLGQTQHYSEKTRKAALTGLSDLFSRHPEELTSHVGLVYSRLMERVADADAGVRQALQALLRERMCPLVAPGQLRPFMPLIMAHIAGATTHLSLEVRSDALGFLGILMDHCPHLVAGGHLAPCLSHFCDLLSPAHRSRSIKGQSLKALIKVLQALCAFLRRAFPRASPSPATTATASSARVPALPPASPLPLFRGRCAWHAAPCAAAFTPPTLAHAAPSSTAPAPTGTSTHTLSASTAAASSASAAGGGGGAPHAVQSAHETAARLLSLLLDCWPECSPATLSVSPEPDQAAALVLILTALQQLTGEPQLMPAATTGRGNAVPGGQGTTINAGGGGGAGLAERLPPAQLQPLLRCVSAAFPACLPAVQPAPQLLETLGQFNLLSAQLLARLLPASLAAQQQQPQRWPHAAAAAPLGARPPHPRQLGGEGQEPLQPHGQQAAPLPAWVPALVGFYQQVLLRGEVLRAGALLSQATQGGHISCLGNTHASAGLQQQQQQQHQRQREEPQGGGGKGSRAAVPAPAVLVALAGVEELLCVLGPGEAAPLVAALDAFTTGLPAPSALRAACLQLQRRLLDRWRQGELHLDVAWAAGWLAGLPRLLWELGAHAAPGTWALALGTLLDAARFSTPGSELAQTVRRLQPQLAPLWSLQVPGKARAKGGEAEGSKQVLAGPVTQLHEPLQLLAIDMLCQLGPLEPPLLVAVLRVLRHQLLPPAAALRLAEALLHSAAAPGASAEAAASLLATLLFMSPPATPPAPAPSQWPQQDTGGEAQPAGPPLQGMAEWAPRHWALCELVLRQAQRVLPASVLLTAADGTLRQRLAPLLPGAVGGGEPAGVAGPEPSPVLGLLLGSSGDAAAAAGAALAVHAHAALALLALAQHERRAPGPAVLLLPPPPAWLQHMLPRLVTWQCCAVPRLAPASGAASGNSGRQRDANAHALVLQLCAMQQPELDLAPLVLQDAVALSTQVLAAPTTAAAAAAQQQKAARACHSALLSLACALLADGSVRRQCLAAGGAARTAAEQLASQAGVPGHVTADLECMAQAHQLAHATQVLFSAA